MSDGQATPYGESDTWPEWEFRVPVNAPATDDEVNDALSGDAYARRPSVRDGLCAVRLS